MAQVPGDAVVYRIDIYSRQTSLAALDECTSTGYGGASMPNAQEGFADAQSNASSVTGPQAALKGRRRPPGSAYMRAPRVPNKILEFGHFVAVSPVRHSIMRSKVERFSKPAAATQTPAVGAYETDVLEGASISKRVLKGSRSYSSLRSTVPRFPDSSADSDTNGDGRPGDGSTATGLAPAASRTSANTQPSDGVRHGYDPDVLSKASLKTAVQQSALKYSNMGSQVERFPSPARAPKWQRDLGPGVYDWDVERVKPRTVLGPHSIPRVGRDGGEANASTTAPHVGPGSYAPTLHKPINVAPITSNEHIAPAVPFRTTPRWTQTIPWEHTLTTNTRPQPSHVPGGVVPRAYRDLSLGPAPIARDALLLLDTGKFQSLQTSVRKGQRAYSGVFKSKQVRIADMRRSEVMRRVPSVILPPEVPDHIGPGLYRTTSVPALGEAYQRERPSPAFLAVGRGPEHPMDIPSVVEAHRTLTSTLSAATLPRKQAIERALAGVM